MDGGLRESRDVYGGVTVVADHVIRVKVGPGGRSRKRGVFV